VLSVITPARNMARYLPDTLDSVAALRAEHEHLVLDGDSSDGTVELLEQRHDSSLRWISEPDSGQTQAVNKGLALAKGELIAWLNADDAYIPDAVDRAIAHLDSEPEAMAVFGGIRFTDEDGAVFRTHVPKRFSWRRYLYLGSYLPTPTIIFRRELLERAPRLDESYADAADYDFYLRLFRGARVDVSSDVWTQHDEALEIRLGWARSPVDRTAMRAWESLKRALLPRISSWPQPQPSGAVRLLRRG
jgi:glycosyltransferase involved in cell wall biosynthesis